MKRVLLTFVSVLLLLAVFCNGVLGASFGTVQPAASTYLSSYYASATTGDASGEIEVTFIVGSGKTNLTKIGVSKISVCRYDGAPIKTIYGTTSNFLLSSGVSNYAYTYSITGLEPGTSYYAQVTVIAGDANGSDTRTVTTSTVKAGP